MSIQPSGSNNIRNGSSAHQSYAENILNKLCNFFDSKQLCDVVLIAGNDGTRISAHTLVLSAASEYFAAMFVGSLRESFAKEITLHKVNGAVLEILIKYCYTGLLEYSKDLAEDVLVTADFLRISIAVTECGDFFISQLDSTNCLGFMIFAERHNCQSLLKSATEYTRTHFMEVYKNDEFKQLNAEELKILLLSDHLDVPSEENVFIALKLWVEHDLENRKKHIPNLLESIRLDILTPTFLAEDVQNFCGLDECVKPIMEAFKYHCLPNQRSTICRSRRRFANNFTLLGVSGDLSSIESYCPRRGSWSVLGNLTTRHIRCFGMSILDDKIFIVGGFNDSVGVNSLQCLDLNKMTLTTVNSMKEERFALAVVVLEGSLYAIGGRNKTYQFLNTVERWDPSTQVWNYVASMKKARGLFGAAVLNDKIYVCGGRYSSEIFSLATVECYDPVTNLWTLKASMNKKKHSFGVAALNGYLYAIGGYNIDGNVERYDPVSDVWTFMASLSFDAFSCAVLENRLIAVGGTNTAEYNPETNQWKSLPDSTKELDKIICIPHHML